MSQVDRGFDAAFAAVQLSDAPRAGLRLGASLFSGSRLLAVGANLYGKTHPKSTPISTSTHAEHVVLLRRQHYDVQSKLTMYVARRRADGTIGNSRPCENCRKLARLAGIARIWFYENGARKEIAP